MGLILFVLIWVITIMSWFLKPNVIAWIFRIVSTLFSLWITAALIELLFF